jgi:Fe-S cluster biosynthesis and repair protein YggX
MARMVFCAKLGQELEGLDRPTYPGELGKAIFENVSKQAWQQWVAHQTMLMNEYRLTPIDPKARKFLENEMEKFLLKGGAAPPPDYRPPEAES